ncbi:hypothetical protein LX64_00918 [Chitinophaga skermanii]|uniref:Uncharacterized protein n=1 Tax=Chitinophaga skermanii TaxID=331697 RepID=A0A327QVC9_9BACT|nr:hypothetical protein [Chitinophaga skermanii]RAJ08271.1 hypothetical protein LX64_00918 [Chitinophaga skermanii]
MKKTSLLFFGFMCCVLPGFIGCQKSVNTTVSQPRPTPEIDLSLPITQPTPHQLVYDASASLTDPVDMVSVAFNPSTKIVSSTIELSNNVDVSYAVNFTDQVWKVHQTDVIEQKVADLSIANLPLATIQGTIADLEAIMSNVLTTASDEVLYSLSINLSIFKTLERKAANPSDCNCTVHPSFLTGTAYFICQEDHFYEKLSLQSALTLYEGEYGQTTDLTTIKTFVQGYAGPAIPFKDVYGLMVTPAQFDTAITNIGSGSGNCAWWCPLGCGSDHGCCGNYKGCCYYRNIICYIHDKICIDCKPKDFCLPKCKPGIAIIDDPADDPGTPTGPGGPGNPGTPSDAPLIAEYITYWDYLNAVKSYAIYNSMNVPIPLEYNVAELLLRIDSFANSGFAVPVGADAPGFIERLKNFVRNTYLQYPGASYYQATPYPENFPPEDGGEEVPVPNPGGRVAQKA